MKYNFFLRAATCFLVVAIASLSLLSGTAAKYVTSATGQASARVASFSFVAGGEKYVEGNWLGSADEGFWEEITTPSGSSSATQEFSLPLFDYEWVSDNYGALLYGGPGGSTVTVKSVDDAFIVAPGIGHAFGACNNNPNMKYPDSRHKMFFRNDSEVTVRFMVKNITTTGDYLDLPICFDGMLGHRARLDVPYTFPGDAPSHTEWYYLHPDQEKSIDFWWSWIYDCSAGWGDLATGMTTNNTYESNLGRKAAAVYKHLNGLCKTNPCTDPAHAAYDLPGAMPQVQVKFHLTVEQVN